MTQPVQEPSLGRTDARLQWGVNQLFRRPAIVSSGGQAIYAIEVFEVDVPVVVGDGVFDWEIPEDLDGAVLTKVEAYVNTVSSSGTVQVQVRNEPEVGADVDMLSTVISIDVGDLNSKDAATQPVVNLANDLVSWGDHLNIDVDAAGTGTLGLGVILYFFPLATVSLVLTGAQGPAGGVTSFQGQWTIATNYVAGDIVTNNGVAYLVTVNNLSSATTEPGVGATWEDFQALLVDIPMLGAIEFETDGGGFVITPGLKVYQEVPYDCEVTSARLFSFPAGSVVVDVWKDTYANFPPTDADSITSASPPTLTAAFKSEDTVLSGWTTTLNEGDVLAYNIDSVSGIQRLTLSLKILRS